MTRLSPPVYGRWPDRHVHPADHHRRCSSSPIDSRFYLAPTTVGALRRDPGRLQTDAVRPLASPSPIWKDLVEGGGRPDLKGRWRGVSGRVATSVGTTTLTHRGVAGAVALLAPPSETAVGGILSASPPACAEQASGGNFRSARLAHQTETAVRIVAEVRRLTTM